MDISGINLEISDPLEESQTHKSYTEHRQCRILYMSGPKCDKCGSNIRYKCSRCPGAIYCHNGCIDHKSH